MDTFENNDQMHEETVDTEVQTPAPEQSVEQTLEQPTAQNPEQPTSAYRGEGAGRREYAQPQANPYYHPNTAYQQGYYAQNYQPNPYQQPYQQPYYQQPSYVPPQNTQPPRAQKQKKPKKKGKVLRSVIAAVLALALVGGSSVATAWVVDRNWKDQAQQMSDTFTKQIEQMQEQLDSVSSSTVGGIPIASTDSLTPAQVYTQNVQSVVAISSTITTQYYGQTTSGTSTGSGFILSQDGYIVTNYHVVEGASSIHVTMNSGTEYTATMVGGDSTNDVAVLKVEAEGLPAVTLGSSSSMIVGDQVVAIGNPLGTLTNTLTVGFVSAKDRAVTTDGFAINMIQTDAAINSGNSGGPLFNMRGEVIGITSAKYSGSSSSGASIEGIGFAIPIDDVLDIIEDLVNYGYINSPYLGVSVSDMDATAAAYYGLPVGAYLREVTPGYSADRAGLQVKDIITKIGEYEVTGVTSLTRALRHFRAGDTTTITVVRGGVQMELSITLDEKPADTTTSTQKPELPSES